MIFAGLNLLAVVLAAAASFLFGGVWYGALSKPWLTSLGKSEAELKASIAPITVLLLLTLLAEFVMAWVLANLVGHLGPGQVTVSNGLIAGGFCWLGFVGPTLAINNGYQGSSLTLTLIDAGHWLGVLLIQGAVIGWMGLR